MTPDKEDILDAADSNWHYDEGMETTTKKAAYEAMDAWGWVCRMVAGRNNRHRTRKR